MSEGILSVGVDLGTSTTQMIVSRLSVENTAAPFTIPRMEIREREILYRGRIHFTPLLDARTLDAAAIQRLIQAEYEQAGIRPDQVRTGAVIITGETARKENAREVLAALSNLAGDFVVATAGPALESVLAARGAGADRTARELGRYVLHMDIGGGTSNLALFDPEGRLMDTGCLNVGGRLMKFDKDGRITYVSPVLAGMDVSDPAQVVQTLVRALEQAAGLEPPDDLLRRLTTDKTVTLPQEPVVLSFSGGVADLIERQDVLQLQYGDLGVLLGRAIRRSRLCAGDYRLGRETIRATVVGAGSYATELSGSTVFYSAVTFPLQNLPAVRLEQTTPEAIARAVSLFPDQTPVLSLEGERSAGFADLSRLADAIVQAVRPLHGPLVIALEQDMAKALGQALWTRLGPQTPLVCLDGIHVPAGSYLDVGAPVAGGAAVPVVVKTLAFL